MGAVQEVSSMQPGRTRMTWGVWFRYAAAMASPISRGLLRLARIVQGIPAAARILGRGRLNGIWAGITSFAPPRQLARIGSGRPNVVVSDRIALSMFPRPELWSATSGRAPPRYAPAEMPTPSSSRVRPMCRNSSGSRKNRPFARSQGMALTRSIPCAFSSSMIWFSSMVCDPLPE